MWPLPSGTQESWGQPRFILSVGKLLVRLTEKLTTMYPALGHHHFQVNTFSVSSCVDSALPALWILAHSLGVESLGLCRLWSLSVALEHPLAL